MRLYQPREPRPRGRPSRMVGVRKPAGPCRLPRVAEVSALPPSMCSSRRNAFENPVDLFFQRARSEWLDDIAVDPRLGRLEDLAPF